MTIVKTIEKSTHKCEVVKVKLEPHLNSDFLSVVRIYGYTVCVRTTDWKDGDLGVYIPPDSLIFTRRPEFAFLKEEGREQTRVKMKKLRGIVSMGLLIPAPQGSKEGDDLAEYLEVEHYESEEKFSTSGDNVKAPSGYYPKYDIDSIRKYTNVFQEGERVLVTCKIHGAFTRYVWLEQLYVGSRTNWKKEDEKSIWWRALYNTPSIIPFCKNNPGVVLCGETFGSVQDLKYGKNDCYFAAFDVLKDGRWLDVKDFLGICEEYSIPTVPILALDFPFQYDKIEEMANGKSMIPGADNIREGCVVKSMLEGYNEEIGRKILKLVGNDYFLRKEK